MTPFFSPPAIRPFTTRLAGLCLALTVAMPGAAAAEQTTDVTFNVRVKVEGNIAAIDTGIKVYCAVHYTKDDGTSIFRNIGQDIVPQGALFSPQTADGFIDVALTISDMPVGLNINPHAPDGRMGWGCSAYRLDQAKGQSQFISNAGQAISPAFDGTCSGGGGYVSLAGDVSDVKSRCTLVSSQ